MGRHPIRLLPDGLRNQIAAGEVVERPASIVKELLENSLDAGATEIAVVLEQGGLGKISVSDNGSGIPPEELELALSSHATSKLASFADLFAISSFGFRGEALSSIGSVSRLTLSSCVQGTQGRALTVDRGRITADSIAVMRQGTVVEVQDLFSSVPARLKFLKPPPSEMKRCQEIFSRLALAHPETTFRLSSGVRELLHFRGGRTLLEGLALIWADACPEVLRPVFHQKNGMAAEGMAGAPSYSRPRADRMLFYVNGRPVSDRLLLKAARDAYRDCLISREYPSLALFIRLDPAEVDVNVHPAKNEVRFRDEHAVYILVAEALRQSVEEFSPRQGRPEESARLASPADPGFSPPRSEGRGEGFWGTLDEERILPRQEVPNRSSRHTEPVPPPLPDAPAGPSLFSPPAVCSPSLQEPAAAYAVGEIVQLQPRDAGEVMYVDATGGVGEEGWLYLGQAEETYLIAKRGAALFAFDQHALHEAILYKKLRSGHADSRLLAAPFGLRLTEDKREAIRHALPLLEKLGFSFGRDGGEEVEVRAVPGVLRPAEAKEFLLETARERCERPEMLWAALACRGAVKARTRLAPQEGAHLLKEWVLTRQTDYCPHGRPVARRIDAPFFEKLFKRRR